MKENEMKLDLNNFDELMDEAMKGRPGPLDETRPQDAVRPDSTAFFLKINEN